jgi:predicted GNAT family N-acyltransferase
MNNTGEQKNVVIKRAATPQELDRIYRFRYQVYVEHMGYSFPKEDGPVIIDPFDETAVNFYLEKDNEIVGTVRVNICDLDKVDEEFQQAWAVWKLKEKYTEILYSSKLIIHPDHRTFDHLTLLCETADAYCRENKMKLNLAECRRELLPLYKFMGFKEYHEPFYDSVLGELIPLILVADEQQ